MLNIPITETTTVQVPTTATLSANIRTTVFDHVNHDIYIIVDFNDASGNTLLTKEIRTNSAFNTPAALTLYGTVLKAITGNVTSILSTPSPVQASIDKKDIVIQQVATVKDRIVVELIPGVVVPPVAPVIKPIV